MPKKTKRRIYLTLNEWLYLIDLHDKDIQKFRINNFSYIFFYINVVKFLLHSVASLTWWDTPWWGSLVYNSTWLATNILLVPIAALIVFPIFKLFDKFNSGYQNKW